MGFALAFVYGLMHNVSRSGMLPGIFGQSGGPRFGWALGIEHVLSLILADQFLYLKLSVPLAGTSEFLPVLSLVFFL